MVHSNCRRRSSAARIALSSTAAIAVLGLAACSSTPSAFSDHGAPRATAGGARFDLAAGQRLVVITDGGVSLHAGAAGQVSVEAGPPHSSVVSDWHGSGTDTAELDLRCPTVQAPGAGPCPASTDVLVPSGAAVTVQAHNAGVSATGLSGPLNLETVNGDVTVVVTASTAGQPMQLTTRNGSVHASGLRAPTLTAHTVNGDVDLSWASAPSRVTADTTNGSLDLALPPGAPSYAVSAHTRNGEPHLSVPIDPTSANRLTLTTVNGSITTRTAA